MNRRMAGAGISPDRLYRMVRNNLLKIAAQVERLIPGANLKYSDWALSGDVGGRRVQVYFRILRASNAEVAGLPVLAVDGKEYGGQVGFDVARELYKILSVEGEMVASELLKVARELLSIEFDTEDAMKKYLKEHPDADKSKHSVKKQDKSRGKGGLGEKHPHLKVESRHQSDFDEAVFSYLESTSPREGESDKKHYDRIIDSLKSRPEDEKKARSIVKDAVKLFDLNAGRGRQHKDYVEMRYLPNAVSMASRKMKLPDKIRLYGALDGATKDLDGSMKTMKRRLGEKPDQHVNIAKDVLMRSIARDL